MKWTKAQDDIIRQHYPEGGIQIVWHQLDGQKSVNAIRMRAKALGVTTNQSRKTGWQKQYGKDK